MRYVLIFEHKTINGQRGIVDLFDTEDAAMAAATVNAKKLEYNLYVCPLQTMVCGEVTIATTVIAQTVTTAAQTDPLPVVGKLV